MNSDGTYPKCSACSKDVIYPTGLLTRCYGLIHKECIKSRRRYISHLASWPTANERKYNRLMEIVGTLPVYFSNLVLRKPHAVAIQRVNGDYDVSICHNISGMYQEFHYIT